MITSHNLRVTQTKSEREVADKKRKRKQDSERRKSRKNKHKRYHRGHKKDKKRKSRHSRKRKFKSDSSDSDKSNHSSSPSSSSTDSSSSNSSSSSSRSSDSSRRRHKRHKSSNNYTKVDGHRRYKPYHGKLPQVQMRPLVLTAKEDHDEWFLDLEDALNRKSIHEKKWKAVLLSLLGSAGRVMQARLAQAGDSKESYWELRDWMLIKFGLPMPIQTHTKQLENISKNKLGFDELVDAIARIRIKYRRAQIRIGYKRNLNSAHLGRALFEGIVDNNLRTLVSELMEKGKAFDTIVSRVAGKMYHVKTGATGNLALGTVSRSNASVEIVTTNVDEINVDEVLNMGPMHAQRMQQSGLLSDRPNNTSTPSSTPQSGTYNPAADKHCFFCQKLGHFKSECPARRDHFNQGNMLVRQDELARLQGFNRGRQYNNNRGRGFNRGRGYNSYSIEEEAEEANFINGRRPFRPFNRGFSDNRGNSFNRGSSFNRGNSYNRGFNNRGRGTWIRGGRSFRGRFFPRNTYYRFGRGSPRFGRSYAVDEADETYRVGEVEEAGEEYDDGYEADEEDYDIFDEDEQEETYAYDNSYAPPSSTPATGSNSVSRPSATITPNTTTGSSGKKYS